MTNLKSALIAFFFLLLMPFIVGCPCQNNPCDDGLFCNGMEVCTEDGGQAVCSDGSPPCNEGEECDEEMDKCYPVNQEECITLGNNGQTRSILNTFPTQLDVPTSQVQIEARIVGVDKSFVQDLGIDFNLTAEILTNDDEPTGAYSDESRDIVVNSDLLCGPENTQYLVPGNQPENGFLGYVNLEFIPRFEPVQIFIQLPPIKACVVFAEGSFIVPQNFPGLPNHENLPSENRGYGGSMLHFNILDSNNLEVVLQAIEAEAGNTVLAAPLVMAYSGQRFLYMVNDFQPTLGEVKEEFSDSIANVTNNPFGLFTGVTLDVTPTIQSNDTIDLELRVGTQALSYYYSTPFNVNQIAADLQVPEVKTSQNYTKIIAEDGKTVVLGGITPQGSQEIENGVPGLNDIPLIGSLFKGSQFDAEKQELLIFITPRIITTE